MALSVFHPWPETVPPLKGYCESGLSAGVAIAARAGFDPTPRSDYDSYMIAPAVLSPRFRPGQLVRHVRYGYRGVVVDFDTRCKASDEWYGKNQTQPPRNQPWYHVLVDATQNVTYAAQTSLEADPSGEPVSHPLIEVFFSEFTGQDYVRNEVPWPGG